MGDYMKDPVFGVCGLDYYYRALDRMKQLNPEGEIYVFSDNIDPVKDVLKDVKGSVFHYIDANAISEKKIGKTIRRRRI